MALVGAMLALFMLPSTCSKDAVNSDPIGQLVAQSKADSEFTILLYDMEKTGVFSKDYKHRYRVIKNKDGKVVAKDTEWFPITSSYYNQHESNVGMEVAAKATDSTAKRIVGPPGYTNYVGNPQYGYWTEGINDTVVIKEKIVDPTAEIGTTSYYDQATKSTVVLEGEIREGWSLLNKLPLNFVVDTAYVKDNFFRKLSADGKAIGEDIDKKILSSIYYWQFYPHKEYVRTLLQLPTGKIKLAEHQKAREQYRRGYSYYGILLMGGTRRYGTYSSHTRSYSSGRRFSRGGGGFGK